MVGAADMARREWGAPSDVLIARRRRDRWHRGTRHFGGARRPE
jgi:hypothetical protein